MSEVTLYSLLGPQRGGRDGPLSSRPPHSRDQALNSQSSPRLTHFYGRNKFLGSGEALPTETNVESGTSQSKSGTSVNLTSLWNMAHVRQSRPVHGLDFQAKDLKIVFRCSLFDRKRGPGLSICGVG